jgi:hypothetical protein
MAAGTTYKPLATTTTSGSVATITLSSISGAYTDLILVGDGRNNAGGWGWRIRFNGDTGSNYSWTDLEGDGSTAASFRGSNTTSIDTTYSNTSIGNSQSNQILQINNYSNTTTYKTVLSRTNAATSNAFPGTNAGIGMWRNTAAITSITITASGSYMIDGTTFSLYGIAAA